MNETITVTDPGWPWEFTLAMLAGPVAALFIAMVFMVLGFTLRGWRRKEALFGWMQGFLWVTLGSAVFLGLFGGGMGAQSIYYDLYNESITDSLTEAGYENITLDDDDTKAEAFTASRNGEYFEGALVKKDDDTYIIVDLVGAK